MDIIEWVRNAISDPNLTPLRKLLRRPDVDQKLRSSVQAVVDHDEAYQPFMKWAGENTRTLSAVHECDDLPILAMSNQDRWKDRLRERQYGEIRQIIEEIGCPLKRELLAKGIQQDAITARILLGLKLEPDGEIFDVVSTTAELDYDASDSARWAAELEAARRGGCDRQGIWHPVFSLCGRVHGYFEENESRQFDWEWHTKRGEWPPKYERLLLARVTVKLTGTPSFELYLETLSARDRRMATERLRSGERTPAPPRVAPKGPAISASFLDFAQGTDRPIRFERGDVLEGRRSRAVDRDTGDYVECELPHWQAIDSYYHLYSADGTKACLATVQQESIDLSGDGKVGLYKVKVIRIAVARTNDSCSEIADASAPIAQRLAQFIAALWLDNPARHSAEITFDLGARNP
jgi:hypothetical protein